MSHSLRNQTGANSKERTIKYSDSIDTQNKEQNKKELLSKCGKKTLIISIIVGIIIVVVALVVFVCLVLKKDCKGGEDQCNNINPGGGKNEGGGEENHESGKTGDEIEPKSENESKDENEPKSEKESKGENDPKTENKPKDEVDENDDDLPSEEELKETFKSLFKINSEVGTLNQILMESKHNFKVKSESSIDYTYIKAKIDIYIISEESPEQSIISNYYQKKITSSVSINSLCYALKGTDCEYIKYLDLSESNKNNLRNIEQEPNIEDLNIPMCLIEHTESNIILSINCPKNIEENLKSLIEEAFRGIKPETIKGEEKDKTLSDITIETKEKEIEINSFSKLCEIGEEEEDKTCESYKKIITDKEGNFISCNQKLKTETYFITDEYEYNFKDLTSENSESLNTANFKTNLNTLLNFLNNYMEKETYDNMRNLNEEDERNKGNKGLQQQEYFTKIINGFNINASISDNIIMEDKSITESIIKINNNKEEISYNEVNSNLTKTIENFQDLTNAMNSLITILFNDTSKPLEEIINVVISEFTKIDNNLVFKDLSSIFDSTFLIEGINEFPYTIVSAAKNLFSNIKILNDDLLYSVNEYKTKLKDDISTFLSKEHNLIFKLFNNLKELNSLLSSQKSKIASIASFYGLNNTNSSFVKTIERADEILNNYYIDEKNKIGGLLDKLFGKFLNDSLLSIENGHLILDNITKRLENESVLINRGNEDDIKSVIDDIYNAKILEEQIIPKIIEIMKKNIILSNGYLITQKVIEENKNTYSPISESATNTANNLVKNEYVDENFDEIMKYFRQQLIIILKNIEISKRENFPIKSNVLSQEFNGSFEDLETFYKNAKIKIKNSIENDNKNFLKSINEEINSFLKENEFNLTNLVKNIQNSLSKLKLDNLDNKYYEMLNYSMSNITEILDNNNELALTYLKDVKDTTHHTEKIKKTITIFLNKLNEIQIYMNLKFKNDLVNKYKDIINKFKKGLQSIKSNVIIKKYYEYKDLSLFRTHIDIFINQAFSNLDDKISDNIFNSKYLTLINNFITSIIDKINTQRIKINELYMPISKKTYSSDSINDIYYSYTYTKCIIKIFRKCIYSLNKIDYKPKSVSSTDNYQKLLSVEFDNFSKNFDKQFEQTYNIFSENINSYNNIVAILGNELESIIDNFSQKKLDFINPIFEESKSFINDQLGINVLKNSYNYYKNELNERLPTELNSILEQWKTLFNKVYKDIEININKFKYPIEEFSTLALIYYEFYRQNISYSYSDFVVEQIKSDFNYTIKYYYNLFLSKMNKTYSYILSNIPSNQKPFDNIFSNHIVHINNSFNEIMNITFESQKEILNLKNQLNTFKVSKTNFFEVNSHSIDLSYKIEEQIYPLTEKFDEITKMAENKFNSEESVACRFYLENLENEREIDELLRTINKETFLEFQDEEFLALFKEVSYIDVDGIREKILDFLTTSNEEIKSIFEIKRKDYKAQLQNYIFTMIYNKTSLEAEIDELYSEGINNLDSNSSNLILEYIDETIEKIKEHLVNENSRLQNELSSYSNNFNIFTQRLNEYKNKIYNKFYSIIHSVINDFYIDINQKFYTNYIAKHLEILYNFTKNEKFSKTNFMNVSINLKEVMDEDIEILTTEYKNWTLSHINYLNEKQLQHLNDLFNFTNLKTEINNKIDSLYTTILNQTLTEKAIYNSGEEGILDYDFSEAIIKNIETFIDDKINEAKVEIEKMKGNKFVINEDWDKPDFSYTKRNIFSLIESDFDNKFSDSYKSKEEKDFYNVMSVILKDNFRNILDNFIPSFGKDFFERILKYNEIQKIKSLFGNLKYSLGITLTYYLFLTYSGAATVLPEDLEIKIMTLNNINSVLIKKNNEMLSLLNSKFDQLLEYTKNNIVELFIKDIEKDFTLKNDFNQNIRDLMFTIFDNKKDIFENEYINKMNTYIKSNFIEHYTKIVKESTDNIFNFIAENKEALRIEVKELLVMNKDETLKNIENKLNDTLNSIEEYQEYFESFKISKEIYDFLDNYVEKNILSYHQEIKNILDERTKNLLLDYLSKNSENFKKAYLSGNIESNFNETTNLFKKSFFDVINAALKKYGTIDEIYEENLNEEIIKISNKRARRLEEIQKGFGDLELESTLKSLKDSSQSAKQQIQTLDIFSNIEEKIKKYINNIKEQYEITQISIKKRKYTENVSTELNKNLDDLKEISISYYNEYKKNYDKVKEYIQDSILKIDKLIEECSILTNKTINSKYEEIMNNYNKINDTNNKTQKNDMTIIELDKMSQLKITLKGLILKNEFLFYKVFEDGKYKIKGKSINKNRPKQIIIDHSTKVGDCISDGKTITINLNNISSIIDLEFDSNSLVTLITKNYNFSQYTIDYKYYYEKTAPKISNIGGININKKDGGCVYTLRNPTIDEKTVDIILAKSGTINEIL